MIIILNSPFRSFPDKPDTPAPTPTPLLSTATQSTKPEPVKQHVSSKPEPTKQPVSSPSKPVEQCSPTKPVKTETPVSKAKPAKSSEPAKPATPTEPVKPAETPRESQPPKKADYRMPTKEEQYAKFKDQGVYLKDLETFSHVRSWNYYSFSYLTCKSFKLNVIVMVELASFQLPTQITILWLDPVPRNFNLALFQEMLMWLNNSTERHCGVMTSVSRWTRNWFLHISTRLSVISKWVGPVSAHVFPDSTQLRFNFWQGVHCSFNFKRSWYLSVWCLYYDDGVPNNNWSIFCTIRMSTCIKSDTQWQNPEYPTSNSDQYSLCLKIILTVKIHITDSWNGFIIQFLIRPTTSETLS